MRKLLSVLIFVSFMLVIGQNLKSPEEFLGYKVGTDYKIADYVTIQKYFKHLSENSDKIIYHYRSARKKQNYFQCKPIPT